MTVKEEKGMWECQLQCSFVLVNIRTHIKGTSVNIYAHTLIEGHTHTHTHMYVYLCDQWSVYTQDRYMCIHIDIKKYKHIYTYNQIHWFICI